MARVADFDRGVQRRQVDCPKLRSFPGRRVGRSDKVEEGVGFSAMECCRGKRIPDDNACSWGDFSLRSGAHQQGRAMATIEEARDNRPADVAGSAGDEDVFHERRIRIFGAIGCCIAENVRNITSLAFTIGQRHKKCLLPPP